MPKRGAQQLALLGEPSAVATRAVYRGAMQRAKSSKKAAIAPRPWQCIVLGVDQASKRSGWCITVCGRYVDSGELETFDVEAVAGVIRAALETAKRISAQRAAALNRDVIHGGTPVPCVLVYEGHSMRGFGQRSWAIPSYLVAAKRLWLTVWQREAKPFGHTGKHCAAYLAQWVSAVLGSSYVRMEREERRRIEQKMAAGIKGCRPGELPGGDESPAICIAQYGSRSPDVGVLLGKRAKAASLAAWQERP